MDTRRKQREVERPPPRQDYSNKNALVPVGNEHPLLNDLILENMLSYCSSSEQCQARQVCSRWYNASFRALKKSGPPITLQHFDGREKKSDRDLFVGGNPKLLKDFLNEMHPKPAAAPAPPSTTPPGGGIISGIQKYTKFNLQLFATPARPLLTSFWKATGPWLTELTMEFGCSTLKFLESILLCKWTPNLEHLEANVTPSNGFSGNSSVMSLMSSANKKGTKMSKLKCLKMSFSASGIESPEDFTFPIDWKDLFGYHSQLEHFALCSPYNAMMLAQIEPIIVAIGQVRLESNNSKLGLKSLDFFGDLEEKFKEHNFLEENIPDFHLIPWSAASLESLRNAALPLKSLKFCQQPAMPDEVVHQLVSMYGPSLKSLSFVKAGGAFFLEGSPFGQTPTPMMANLRNLVLNGYPFKDLTFLKDLPNLVSLHLWGNFKIPSRPNPAENLIKATTTTLQEGGGGVFECSSSLTQFCCNYSEKWTVDDIIKLKRLMPNLTTLELVLFNRTFRRVCMLWPALEHLAVFQENVGDEGIVGRNTSGYSNLASLQNLRSFAINNLRLTHEILTNEISPITMRSVELGFLKLPRLEKLFIRVHRMDEELCTMLKDKLPPSVDVSVEIPAVGYPMMMILRMMFGEDDEDDADLDE